MKIDYFNRINQTSLRLDQRFDYNQKFSADVNEIIDLVEDTREELKVPEFKCGKGTNFSLDNCTNEKNKIVQARAKAQEEQEKAEGGQLKIILILLIIIILVIGTALFIMNRGN